LSYTRFQKTDFGNLKNSMRKLTPDY